MFLSNLKWSYLGEIYMRTVQPIAFLSAATFLTKTEFSKIGIILSMLAACQMLWESGVAKSIIKFEDTLELQSFFQFLQVIISISIGILLYIFRFDILNFLNWNLAELKIIYMLSIFLILTAPINLRRSVYMKRMQFKNVFYLRMVYSTVLSFVFLLLVLLNQSAYSLMFAAIIAIICQIFFLKIQGDGIFFPLFKGGFLKHTKKIRFSIIVLSVALIHWAFAWLDTFIISSKLSPESLANYTFANTIVVSLYGLTVTPLIPVLYSYLNRISLVQRSRLVSNYCETITYVSVIAIAISILFCEVLRPLLPNKYQETTETLTLLILLHGSSIVTIIYGEVYRAAGTPWREFQALVISCFLYFLFIKFYDFYEVEDYLVGRVIVTQVIIFIQYSLFAWTYKINKRLSFELLLFFGSIAILIACTKNIIPATSSIAAVILMNSLILFLKIPVLSQTR